MWVSFRAPFVSSRINVCCVVCKFALFWTSRYQETEVRGDKCDQSQVSM